MSRKTKSAIIISAIAIAVGISIMLVIVYNPTRGIFQRATSEDDDDNNNNPSFDGSFGFNARYKTTLLVGEEESFNGTARNGKVPYTFEWKFSDGLTLAGQKIMRSFDSPGRYYFDVTITDADGKQVKSSNLSLNVLQEMAKEEI